MATKVFYTVSQIDTPAGRRWVAAAWTGIEFIMTSKAHDTYTQAREALPIEIAEAGKQWELSYFQSGREENNP